MQPALANARVNSRVGPVDEYQSLRAELSQSRRYVFDRPLVIVAVGVAGLEILEAEFVALVPILVPYLLLFNFWFTLNRLKSAARIVAYIQLELEESSCGPWVGWESCLREYRRWHNNNERDSVTVDEKAAGKALMYYPAIRNLHLGLMAFVLYGSSILAAAKGSLPMAAGTAIGSFAAVALVLELMRNPESSMRTLIERERALWVAVFEGMDRKQARR